jgi:hypothetical protein
MSCTCWLAGVKAATIVHEIAINGPSLVILTADDEGEREKETTERRKANLSLLENER